jgi:hypothetical protein
MSIKQEIAQQNTSALNKDLHNRRIKLLTDEMRKCYFANAPLTEPCQELVDAYLVGISQRSVWQYDPDTKTVSYPPVTSKKD